MAHPDLAQAKAETRSHLGDHVAQAQQAHRDLMARLHRFLVAHKRKWSVSREDTICVDCGADPSEPHAPDCEWVALVALTQP